MRLTATIEGGGGRRREGVRGTIADGSCGRVSCLQIRFVCVERGFVNFEMMAVVIVR